MRRSWRALAHPLAAVRSYIARRKRFAALVEQLMYWFPAADDALVALARGDSQARYARWIAAHDTLDHADLSMINRELLQLDSQPFFSVIVPLSGSDSSTPSALMESLHAQIYTHWEVNTVAAAAADQWNGALRSAAGDYVVVVDCDFVLRPHTLFLFAHAIAQGRDTLLVYGDEDEIDAAGERSRHYFKPDWNQTLLRSQHYFGGAVCYRRSAVLDTGGFEGDARRDLAWDLSSRLTARASPWQIEHLPFVLSHRVRTGETSPKGNRRGASLEERSARRPESVSTLEGPLVSVIVPTTARLDHLRPCVTGLLENTSYPALEILLVVNNSKAHSEEQRRFLEGIAERPEFRVLHYDERPYNFAKTNNWAVEHAAGELLCFLNDDTEVINREWLSALVAETREDGVAGAGALLLYPNDRIQHAGVILGMGGVAAHAYCGRPRHTRGYHDRALIPQDISCVTAACMLVRREAFVEAGCFDPTFATSFNDVDLCLRLREAGWRIVWSPAAQLYHKESASIGRHSLDQQWEIDYERIRSRWLEQLLSDPHYSPNLSLDRLQAWEPAFPPRVAYPWRHA